VVRDALASLGPSRPLHLSYDIDALDPLVAPATGTLVRGGLTFREGHYIAEALAETGRLCGMDMVEVNALLGKDDGEKERTTEMALVVMASALGSRIL
jgi:arginase